MKHISPNDPDHWGVDEYGRYHQVEGERYLIEPHPYGFWPPWHIWMHILARFSVIRWWLHRGWRTKTHAIGWPDNG